MWEQIMTFAAESGLWALLFCGLLVFELTDSRAREKKYQGTIAKLSDDLGALERLDERVEDLADRLAPQSGDRTGEREAVE